MENKMRLEMEDSLADAGQLSDSGRRIDDLLRQIREDEVCKRASIHGGGTGGILRASCSSLRVILFWPVMRGTGSCWRHAGGHGTGDAVAPLGD
jgi:hypothetical protein